MSQKMNTRRSLFLALVFWPAFAKSQDAAAVRVGVLGVDNYQSIAYTAIFNDPIAAGDLAGLKVTVCFPDAVSADIPESVTNFPKWKERIPSYGVELVDSIEAMLARCDVVMMMSLDGRKHREQAAAVLKAGKRLYIGRPLANSLNDALAILENAEKSGTPMFSSSQHRFSPGFIGMRNHPEVGAVLGCDVYGGYDLKSSTDDPLPIPLHSIETLYTIMGGAGCEAISCVSTPRAEVWTCRWKDGRVGTYRGIKEGAVKYSATVFGDKGVSTSGVYGHGVPEKGIVPLKDKYMGYEGIAIEMAKFFKGGPTPVSIAETREIFLLLQAALESRARGGTTVRLEEIAARSKGRD
jgi:hypothetical protein